MLKRHKIDIEKKEYLNYKIQLMREEHPIFVPKKFPSVYRIIIIKLAIRVRTMLMV